MHGMLKGLTRYDAHHQRLMSVPSEYFLININRGLGQWTEIINLFVYSIQIITQEKTMVERDKDSLKSSLAQSLLHSNQLTEELVASQTQNGQLTKQVKLLQDKLEKVSRM